MTFLRSILQRQLSSSQPKSYIPIDFAVKSFCCHRVDEHVVRGRDDTMDVPPFASRFSESELGGHLLACADEDGSVTLHDTRKYGHKSILKEWTAHHNAIFDIAWMEGEPKLITASGDQTAILWDVERGERLSEFKGHSCSLKSVNFRKNDIFTFGTGARDGNIMIWDIRCNRRGDFHKPVNIIRNAHTIQLNGTPQRVRKRSRRGSAVQANTDSQQSVPAIIFQDDNKLISAGAMDGNIKVWDLRKTYTTLRCEPMYYHLFPYPGNEPRRHGFSSLVLDSNQSKLYASCTNDRIYMYECTVFKESPVYSFTGHQNSTFYVKATLSPDGNYLLSGSSDNDAYIWNVNVPQAPPMMLKGHMGEVTSVAWCPVDIGKLVTCSDDNNVRIWRMNCNQSERKTTDLVGSCEQSEPKSTSPTVCNDVCLATPSKLSSPIQSSIISTPTSNMRLGSPIHVPSSPKSFTPNTPSPGSNRTQRKQQLLSSWLKLTPSKENTATISPSSRESAPPSVQNHVLTSSNCTEPKNKKSLFNDGAQDKQTKELRNSMENDEVCNGKRSKDFVKNGELSVEDSTSPARKRQCIAGLSDLNNHASTVCDNTKNGSIQDDNEKENIGPNNKETTNEEKNNSYTDKNINWFINWKIYIKHHKTNVRSKKSATSEESEEATAQTISGVPKLVEPGQGILKYFKPTLSPIREGRPVKEHKS